MNVGSRHPCSWCSRKAGRAFVALVALLLASTLAWGHPKPGAHADVRITIEDDAVRVQVLMNILFADQILNVPRQARDQVEDAEVENLRGAVEEYFGGSRRGPGTALVDRPNQVRIDGVEVSPVIREIRIIRPDPETRPGFVQNPALLLPQIHIVAEYSCKAPPKVVSLVWGTFVRDFAAQNRDIAPLSEVEAVLMAHGGLDLITFRKSEPEYIWRAPVGAPTSRMVPVPARATVERANDWRVPVGSLIVAACWLGWVSVRVRTARLSIGAFAGATALCAALAVGAWPLTSVRIGGAQSTPRAISEAEAIEVFTPLQTNVYRAFDYTRESDIYDALARSVDGPLLDTIYNQIYSGLVMQEEGGALSRVRTVTPLEFHQARDTPPPEGNAERFALLARWRVEGVVYHWGHSHTRITEYLAQYSVALRPGGWRIVDVRPIEQQRIETPAQAGSAAALPPAAPTNQGGTK